MNDHPGSVLQKETQQPASLAAAWKKAVARTLAEVLLIAVMAACLWSGQPHEGACAALFAANAAFFAEDYAETTNAGFLVGALLSFAAALVWLFLLLI